MDQSELLRLSDALYEQHVRPLEAEHYGEYVAIFPDGRTILGPALIEVAQRAKDTFGPGAHLFKIGPKAVGKLR